MGANRVARAHGSMPALVTKEYRTVSQIRGPVIVVERVAGVAYNELVEVVDPAGAVRLGQVLEVGERHCVVRVFAGTTGLSLVESRVRFTGDVARLDVSPAL